MNHNVEIDRLLEKIRGFASTFEALARNFRADIAGGEATAPLNKYSADDWRRNTYGNVLVRFRQLAETNFRYIETLSLLANSRYVFEASIWLHLFRKDLRYGLVFFSEWLKTQTKHHVDNLAQLHREIILLRKFETMEEIARASALTLAESDPASIISAMKSAELEVDDEASKHFAVYAEQAKINGYGFQAWFIEQKVIPNAEQAVREGEREKSEFEQKVPPDVLALCKGRWQWREMSKAAGIEHEHDFIYSYASKLLHATPVSIFTDDKHLEPVEICLFLRYIYVKFQEVSTLAKQQPESMAKPH